VSIRFFSDEEGAPRAGQPAREGQQALLLRLLREAHGATVSYQRLRDAGIELPASVVSELELAGFPIEHGHEGGGGSTRHPGVRLNPELDPERAALDGSAAAGAEPNESKTAARRAWAVPSGLRPSLPRGMRLRVPSGVRPPSGLRLSIPSGLRLSIPSGLRLSLPPGWRLSESRGTTRALAPLALIGAMVIVIAVVVIALQTSRARHAGHHASKAQPRSTVVVRAPQSPAPQAPATPATPVSPVLATEFEAQGHDLLQSGQYSDAVPILRRALAATGMQLNDCLEPASETCLTYAYALYDLGRALEMNGDPGAALPVLERRLQIDNQRDVVAAELAHVRTIVQQ
jgi:hypothetical protein